MQLAAVVNQELCICCGLCFGKSPDLFRINSKGKAEFFKTGEPDTDKIQSVIDGCPVQAISWA